MSHFEVVATAKNGKARAGRLTTAHGVIETPVFMPVGTQATVKGLLPQMVADAGGSGYFVEHVPFDVASRGGPHRQHGGIAPLYELAKTNFDRFRGVSGIFAVGDAEN